MPKPEFFIIGAPKCGTSSLHVYLQKHPQIFLPDKEIAHFAQEYLLPHDKYYTRESYLSLFAQAPVDRLCGESSVVYLQSKNAARLIHEFCPTAKLIAMFREPARMLHAHHGENTFHGFESLSFQNAIAAESERRERLNEKEGKIRMYQRLFYSDVVDYRHQLDRFRSVFSDRQIHLVLFDDFQINTRRAYLETLRFLGCSVDFIPDFQVVNPSKVPRSKSLARLMGDPPSWLVKLAPSVGIPRRYQTMAYRYLRRLNRREQPRPALDPELRAELNRRFEDQILYLEQRFQRKLDHWPRTTAAAEKLASVGR